MKIDLFLIKEQIYYLFDTIQHRYFYIVSFRSIIIFFRNFSAWDFSSEPINLFICSIVTNGCQISPSELFLYVLGQYEWILTRKNWKIYHKSSKMFSYWNIAEDDDATKDNNLKHPIQNVWNKMSFFFSQNGNIFKCTYTKWTSN